MYIFARSFVWFCDRRVKRASRRLERRIESLSMHRVEAVGGDPRNAYIS